MLQCFNGPVSPTPKKAGFVNQGSFGKPAFQCMGGALTHVGGLTNQPGLPNLSILTRQKEEGPGKSLQQRNHRKRASPRPFSIPRHRDMSPLRDCIVWVHAQIDLCAQIFRPGRQG